MIMQIDEKFAAGEFICIMIIIAWSGGQAKEPVCPSVRSVFVRPLSQKYISNHL